MWKRNPKGEKVLEVLKRVVRIDPFPAYGLECGQSTCRAAYATPHEWPNSEREEEHRGEIERTIRWSWATSCSGSRPGTDLVTREPCSRMRAMDLSRRLMLCSYASMEETKSPSPSILTAFAARVRASLSVWRSRRRAETEGGSEAVSAGTATTVVGMPTAVKRAMAGSKRERAEGRSGRYARRLPTSGDAWFKPNP